MELSTEIRSTLVLGAGPRLACRIARSLSKRGIPVIVAALSPDERKVRSRAISRFVYLPDAKPSPKVLAFLLRLVADENIDMIMPTGDGALLLMNMLYGHLPEGVILGCPDPDVVQQVLDKDKTLATALELGIPTPKTVTVQSPEDARKAMRKMAFPLIAKPQIRESANKFKVAYYSTPDDLSREIDSAPDWWRGALLQEYVPGYGVGISTLMQGAEALVLFQHRRLKELPFSGGVSVMACAERVNPHIAEAALRLLREIGWNGIASVEFRYDPDRNRFALMEINGRYWGSLFLSHHAGLDFPYYEWQLAHGQIPAIPDSYRIGVRARWLVGDLERLIGIWRKGTIALTRPNRIEETGRFFSDFFGCPRDALFSIKDPLPALDELCDCLWGHIKSGIKDSIAAILPDRVLLPIKKYRSLGKRLGKVYLQRTAARSLGLVPKIPKIDPLSTSHILFVCLGNIIRSPMAEIQFRSLSNGKFDVQSSGTWKGLETKAPRKSPQAAIDAARSFDFDLKPHRSQPTTPKIVDWADIIFVMDYFNEASLLDRFPQAASKTYLLGHLSRTKSEKAEIDDPYGGSEADIGLIYKQLTRAVTKLGQLANQPRGTT